MQIRIKWKGKEIDPSETSESSSVLDLKAIIEPKTGILPGNQKLLWKGSILKDDTLISSLNLGSNDVIMLMGTVASAIPSGTPRAKVDDNEAATGQASEANALLHPGGLQNIGNTCYLNSVIQMLKSSTGFEGVLESVKSTLNTDKAKWSKKDQLINSFAKVLSNLKNTSVLTPTELVIVLRGFYPQFAEIADGGLYAQQDAHECIQVFLNLLGSEQDLYFGEFTTRLSKLDDVVEAYEQFNELTCHISQETTDLLSGIQESLTEKINSGDQIMIKSSKISRAPNLLFVRFNRFFWKQKEQIKAKILKKVKFPLVLDVASICTPGMPDTKYVLRAVLTHIGRSADSGHYICWAKDPSTMLWWKFDDDNVSAVTEEEILKLDGGGDWHMAYICLYERCLDKSE